MKDERPSLKVQIPFTDDEPLLERIRKATQAGAEEIIIAFTNADLDHLAASDASTFSRQMKDAGITVDAVTVTELTRLSEISTHPVSREKTQARLQTALEVAKVLGAKRLILAAKEVVPADVAAPAYKVALRSLVAQADVSGIRVELEPVNRWPLSEAEELLVEIQPMILRMNLP